MDPQLLCSVAQLSNDALLARVKYLVQREREVTALLIAHLAELDERRLYLAEGCPSLFAYCTQVLHLSEPAAYARIAAARAARRFPVVLEGLADGSVTLTTVTLLAAHLTDENHRDVLDLARHKSKRQIEELVARLRPQPDVPAIVRKLPTVSHTAASPPGLQDAAASPHQAGDAQGNTSLDLSSPSTLPPPRPAVIAPLAPQRYKVQFTASVETYEKLRFAQALLRHQIPDGNPAEIFDRALTALLEDLTRKKLAATDRPRDSSGPVSSSRHIPAEVKRAVWTRDAAQCAFVSRGACRCAEQGFLEFHHVAPHAAGGKATAENIQLRCRAHNGYEAELYFGPRRLAVREASAWYLCLTGVPQHTIGHPPTLCPDRVSPWPPALY